MVFYVSKNFDFLILIESFHAHLKGHLAACLRFQSRVQSTFVVSSYVMAKNIKPKVTTDGKVQSVAGKAKWTVRWDRGPAQGDCGCTELQVPSPLEGRPLRV